MRGRDLRQAVWLVQHQGRKDEAPALLSDYIRAVPTGQRTWGASIPR